MGACRVVVNACAECQNFVHAYVLDLEEHATWAVVLGLPEYNISSYILLPEGHVGRTRAMYLIWFMLSEYIIE